MPGGNHYCLRTESFCLRNRHRRMYTLRPRFIGGRRNHSAITFSSYDYRFSPQGWIAQDLRFYEKSIHIDMQNIGSTIIAAPITFGGGRLRSFTHRSVLSAIPGIFRIALLICCRFFPTAGRRGRGGGSWLGTPGIFFCLLTLQTRAARWKMPTLRGSIR